MLIELARLHNVVTAHTVRQNVVALVVRVSEHLKVVDNRAFTAALAEENACRDPRSCTPHAVTRGDKLADPEHIQHVFGAIVNENLRNGALYLGAIIPLDGDHVADFDAIRSEE